MKPWQVTILALAVFSAIVRPLLDNHTPVYAQSRSITDSVINPAPPSLAFTQRIDYDGSGNAIYVGMSSSANTGGPATSSAIWSIKKITYNGSNQATLIQWAKGSTSQTNIWDNRTSLSYQ